ncbi:MAG: universal stress protein [Gemmatimonadales bacterium]|nr:MAG: universal stress protein [Gemmatimonadales bacterium]
MIRRILIPLDGSDAAEAVLGHAVLLGKAFEAELHLLRVLSRSGSAGNGDPVDPLAWRLARARASTYLSRVAKDLREEGLGVTTEVQEGVPGEVIVETLRRGRHHLVVLTSHGSGKRSCMRVGGTALSVILNSGTSVMLVPASWKRMPWPPEGYTEILAPVDGSPRGDWALGVAATAARGTGARLQMVHVLAPPELLSRLPESADARELTARVLAANRREAELYMKEMQGRLSGPRLKVGATVEECEEGVPRSLERVAGDRGADLIVLSAHGRGATPEWPFGGTSERLLLSGNFPVLVLQDFAGGVTEPGEGAPEASQHFRDA